MTMTMVIILLVILLYTTGYKYDQENNLEIPAAFDDLVTALDLPLPKNFTSVFEDLPASKIFSERSLRMLESDCYA